MLESPDPWLRNPRIVCHCIRVTWLAHGPEFKPARPGRFRSEVLG